MLDLSSLSPIDAPEAAVSTLLARAFWRPLAFGFTLTFLLGFIK